jgi:ERCC4-type nuclease
VFYLIEGKPTQSATIKESALDTAMLNTQILNGLKVRTTVNLQETLKWLIMMNNSIESKVLQEMKKDDKDYLEFQYTYDEYQVITAKNNMNMKILFGNMMRQVKGLGRETISEFLEKFDSFNDFYSYFTKIQANEEKLSFLGQKEKKSKKKKGLETEFHDPKELKVNKTVAGYIMTLFNADAYPKVLSKDSIKFHEDTTL